MTRICLAALAVVALVACEPPNNPYLTLREPHIDETFELLGVTFDATGAKVDIRHDCTQEVIEHWCPVTDASCQKPTHRRDKVTCAKTDNTFTVTTPWGRSYTDKTARVAIDWRDSGIDPLGEEAARLLRVGWRVRSSNRAIDSALAVSDADITAMRLAIGAATDTQFDLAPDAKLTQLTAKLDQGNVPNSVTITVTNVGTAPAYRVVAILRSSHKPIHNLAVSFGRIDPGRAKTRTQAVVGLSEDGEEAEPMVIAEVAGANAGPSTTNARIKLVREAHEGLRLDCKLPDDNVAPGRPIKVSCELVNDRSKPVRELTYALIIDGKAVPVVGPAALDASSHAHLELGAMLGLDIKSGRRIPVLVAINGDNLSMRSAPLSINVLAIQRACTGKRLTQAEYETKHKHLQAARDSGSLSQEEFDNYDAELVGCLQ